MNPSKKRSSSMRNMQKKIVKWTECIGSMFVLWLFLVHPFFFTSEQIYTNITVSKIYSFVAILSISMFMLIIVLISAEVTKASGPKIALRENIKSVRPYEWAMLIYWLVMGVSTLLSDNRIEALKGAGYRNEGLLMMTAYLLAVLIAGRIYRPKQWHFAALGVAAAIVCTYGIMQYYGHDPLGFNPTEWNVGPGLVFISTMSNRNVLSTYLTIVFCICAVLFAQSKKLSAWVYMLVGMVTFYMLVLGQTESGYIGLIIAFLLMFPFVANSRLVAGRLLLYLSWCPLAIWVSLKLHAKHPEWATSFWQPFEKYLIPAFSVILAVALLLIVIKKLPHIPTKGYRIGWYVLVAAMIMTVVVSVPKLAEISDYDTIEELNQVLQGNLEDKYGSWRGFIWKRAIKLVPERPLFGYGPDNFMIAFEEAFGEEAIAVTHQSYDKAHNEYLQQLVDNGIVGLLAFVAFFLVIIYGARKHMNTPLVTALVLAMVCFMGQAFFNFSTPFAHPISWALWGVLGGYPFAKIKGN